VIVAFSTSSPLASVALIDPNGEVIAAGGEWVPRAASGACLKLLDTLLRENALALSQAELFLSDLGPGSFTGVKVGVTLAKTLAFAQGKQVGGLGSFDLIDATGTVVLPSKRGEWFVRNPGHDPIRQTELPPTPFSGYGTGIEDPTYPRAKNFARQLSKIVPMIPEKLLPEYLIEPSISIPKKPFLQPAS
jgi:tRNA threonylcarbamoyladenosine biosynthesis protein TsaB